MTDASSAVQIRVYGEPQPQGNKTGFAVGGRVVMVEGRRGPARDAFKTWRGGVTQEASAWIRDNGHDNWTPLDEPVSVEIVFWLTKPASLPKWRWLPHSRPDIDKLSRAVLDGITGTIIKDDGRVVELVARKVYALDTTPGCRITVEPLGDEERARSAA